VIVTVPRKEKSRVLAESSTVPPTVAVSVSPDVFSRPSAGAAAPPSSVEL